MKPGTGKLFHLLKTTFPLQTYNKIKNILNIISDNCEQFSEYTVPLFKYHKSISKENILFNMEIAMDLVWFEH